MTTLRVAELDFDTIKFNLKQFLSSKPEFTDYDFEGSGLSVIIDLLAYNTHYNAVIGNMLIEEMFLDTAVKPASIALIAKRLGYTPMSMRSPVATISIEVFPSDSPASITLGKNAKFSATIDNNTSVTFVTRDAYTITANGEGRYIFPAVKIYEGANYSFSYVVDTSEYQRFEIPSTSVDMSLLTVTVQDSTSSTNVVEWTGFSSILDLEADTQAYFTKINEKTQYEVYFGDGVFGQSIITGNVVTLNYLNTNGPVANGASRFTFADSIGGYSNFQITLVSKALGGAYAESIESIRKNAQNTVFSQNRAITENDYATLINKFIPVESISVWGGETLTPPVYGKIFIAIKQPNTTTNLDADQKQELLANIQSRTSMGLIKEIVDVEYVNLAIKTDIKYDSGRTTLGPSTIITNVVNSLASWGAATLNVFNSDFEFSKLVAYIDDISPAFLANDTDITFSKTKSLVLNINTSYVFDFYSSIKQSNSIENNITSTPFRTAADITRDVYLADTAGVLYTYYIRNSERIILTKNVGTVDYATGKVSLSTTMVASDANTLTVTVIPDNKNSIQSRNNIITLDTNDIEVTLRSA